MITAALMLLAAGLSGARADTALTLGDTPTVVAFVGAEQAEILFSADWAPIFSGFKPGLDAARSDLEKLRVVVREVYAPSIPFRFGEREWRLEPEPSALLAGYYLWSPEGPSYLCRGAMKKDDLVRTVMTFLAHVRDRVTDPMAGCERAEP